MNMLTTHTGIITKCEERPFRNLIHSGNDGVGRSPVKILYLCPLVWRPLKAKFARKFQLLSQTFSGEIFTTGSGQERGLPIFAFRLYSEKTSVYSLVRYLRRLWVQIVLPIYLNWHTRGVKVIIAYDPYSSALAGMVLRFVLRAKLIVEVNGDYHRREPVGNIIKRKAMRFLFHLALRVSDAVKTLNRDQEEYITFLLPGKKVYRFPNFVVNDYFESLETFQGDYVLSVGYPFDLKGMDVLIRAFQRIWHKHDKMKLRIMGHCPEEKLEKYKQMAQENGRIEFVKAGWMEDVGEQMRGCYVLVNAARSEAMGRVHLEAMACKKPIVATRTNGGMQCVEDGRTGLLCEIEDVEDLARKLDEILSDPKRAEEMGRAGFECLQRKFSEKEYFSRYESMIQEAAGS